MTEPGSLLLGKVEALQQNEEKFLRALMGSASVGVVVIDEDGCIIFVNPKTEQMFGYQQAELIGQSVEILIPRRFRGSHLEHRADYLSKPRAREMGSDLELAAQRKDGSKFPVEIGLSFIEIERGILIAGFITDITERKQAEERLHETQRTLSTLMSNLPGMAYRCHNDRDWTMEFVSEGCFDLTGYYPSDLIKNRNVAYGQLIHSDDQESAWNKTQAALKKRQPFQLNYRLITASGEEKWVWEQGRGVFSSKGDLLALEGFVTDYTERVLAYQTLEQRVEERTHEIERRQQVAEGLRDILAILNSDRPVEEILDYIVAQAKRLLEANASAIYRLQSEDAFLTIRTSQGLPAKYIAKADMPLGQGTTGQAVLIRQPVAVPDIATADLGGDARTRARRQTLMRSGFYAVLAVPLLVKGEVYGALVLYYSKSHTFSAEEIDLAVTFAAQAALAIENARLRMQVEQAAVVAERSRLARDLHDAVTQMLFSASLIAEVLPRLWERNPDEGRRRLDELRQLARGALAEMRTLLLELRPSRLTEASLGDLLRQLIEAVSGRAQVPITLEVEGECTTLPGDVQVSLYRTAQEALNNVAKHAQANQAIVSLNCQPNQIYLSISDDGRGFAFKSVTPDNLGLTIMHERAEAIGAELEIKSEIGQGTNVVVVWKK